MDDRDIVAAIVAGEADGIASAYDKYAESLFGYCCSATATPADAATALRDTFIVAAARLESLRDPRKLRPWLYAVARAQCRPAPPDKPTPPTESPESPESPEDPEDPKDPEDLKSPGTEAAQALAALHPAEREVIELNLAHQLSGSDLAAVLGVKRSQAHARLAGARARLEKAPQLATLPGQPECPVLDELRTADGQRTTLQRKRIQRHVSQCEPCTSRIRDNLDKVVLAPPSPPAPPPAGILENDEAYRVWVIEHAGPFGPTGFPLPARAPKRPFTGARAAAAAAVLIVAVSGVVVAALALNSQPVPHSQDVAHTSSGSASAGTTNATRGTNTAGAAAPSTGASLLPTSLTGPSAPSSTTAIPPRTSTTAAPSRSATPTAPTGSGPTQPQPQTQPPTPAPTPPPASPSQEWPPPPTPPATGIP